MTESTSPTSPPADASQSIAAEAPTATAGPMTPEQLAEARQYGREQLGVSLADKLLDLVYLALAAFLLARPLDNWLAALVPNGYLRLVALYTAVILLHECISFPLAYYGGHVLESRYGLSRQSLPRWLWRHAKRFTLTAVFGGLLFVGLFAVIWLVGPWWWLVAAVAFFGVSVVLGQLAPVLILPLFYKIERLDDAELSQRLTRLAAGTGLSISGIYRMVLSDETAKANAMLAGLGRTRRVLMGDTLLESFTPEEIEVVFAHEIGHHVYRHIPKLILFGLVFGVAGFWLCDRALALWIGPEYAASSLPVSAAPMLMFVLTLFSLLLEPLQNALSRRFERQCDRYALARTMSKAAYLSAFGKLAVLNKDDPDPHPLEVFLFHSHPPITQRLAAADAADGA
jgi:STE24 endopeptidase